MKDYEVIVRFGKGVPPDLQGRALLNFERFMREAGCPAEVFKSTMADDSRLRLALADPERRAKL